LPFLASLALAVVIVGCGGGGGEESTATTQATTTAALSKQELIAQGDAICAEVNAAVGTIGSTSSGAGGQAAQVAGLYSGMVERLKGLGAPSDESAGYSEFIGSAEALDQAEANLKLAAEREEGEALATAESKASSALDSFQSDARSFGFEQCAEAPAAPTPSASSGGEPSGEEAGGAVEEEAAPEEAAPEEEATPAPESGGAGAVEEEGAGGGAGAGGGTEGGGEAGGGGSGGIGPG
jgi:hypothetical protein